MVVGSRRSSNSAHTSSVALAVGGRQQPGAHRLGAFDERLDIGELVGGELAKRLEGGRARLRALQQDACFVE